MRVVINAILAFDKPRGVGIYLNNIIKSLINMDKENEYIIFYGKWMKENYSFCRINSRNVKFVEITCPNNKLIRNLYQLLIFPLKAKRYNGDVIFIPDTSPVLYKSKKIVSTIHDIAEYTYPEKYSLLQSIFRRQIVKYQCKNSRKIIVVSEHTKKNLVDIINIPKDKIITIYNGVDYSKFKKSNFSTVLKKYNIQKEEYLLYVGEIERTKNISVIISALSKIENKRNKLVICGKKGNDYETVISNINKLNMKDWVVFTDYVTDDELIQLYSNAKAFIFPSLFEGFGLPLVEAMATETPVISSKSSCLPEVGGNAAIYFDPKSSDELKKCIEKILNDDFRRELIKRGLERKILFDWEIAAKKTKNIFEEVFNNKT